MKNIKNIIALMNSTAAESWSESRYQSRRIETLQQLNSSSLRILMLQLHFSSRKLSHQLQIRLDAAVDSHSHICVLSDREYFKSEASGNDSEVALDFHLT